MGRQDAYLQVGVCVDGRSDHVRPVVGNVCEFHSGVGEKVEAEGAGGGAVKVSIATV